MELNYSFRTSKSDHKLHGEFPFANRQLTKQHIRPVLIDAIKQKWMNRIDLATITYIECYYYDKNGNEIVIS